MAKLALLGGTPVRTIPYMQWPFSDDREIQAVTEVIRSGKWFRYDGTKVEEFEKAFAEAHGAAHAIAVTNGTAAIEVALLSLGIGVGDEVIVPSYTFIATASAVVYNNATPVFVDVQPDTFNIDPKCFEAAITEKTKAVIAVHFAGFPADMDEIISIAKKHNIYVIEDAAHAHGGEYKGKMLGSIGDAAGFSFQASKNMTSGEGGAILTNDTVLAEKMYSRHTLGRLPERAWYEHFMVGTNIRMTEMQAAILLVQLSRLHQQTKERLVNAKILDKCVSTFPSELGLMRPCCPDTEKRAYHLYMLKYLQGGALADVSREIFVKAMLAEGLIISTGYKFPLYKQEMFSTTPWGINQKTKYEEMHHPVAEHAMKESLWINQQVLVGDDSQVNDITAAIEKIIENAAELKGIG